MNKRMMILPVVAALTAFCALTADARWPYSDQPVSSMTYPEAPMPPPGTLITPPGENIFFPMRHDGQPFILQIDETVNMTDHLNRMYYDPAWRGEVWQPFQCYELVEKGVRLLPDWPAYDAATQCRHLTKVHQFFEKWSGFGPQ